MFLSEIFMIGHTGHCARKSFSVALFIV